MTHEGEEHKASGLCRVYSATVPLYVHYFPCPCSSRLSPSLSLGCPPPPFGYRGERGSRARTHGQYAYASNAWGDVLRCAGIVKSAELGTGSAATHNNRLATLCQSLRGQCCSLDFLMFSDFSGVDGVFTCLWALNVVCDNRVFESINFLDFWLLD